MATLSRNTVAADLDLTFVGPGDPLAVASSRARNFTRSISYVALSVAQVEIPAGTGAGATFECVPTMVGNVTVVRMYLIQNTLLVPINIAINGISSARYTLAPGDMAFGTSNSASVPLLSIICTMVESQGATDGYVDRFVFGVKQS